LSVVCFWSFGAAVENVQEAVLGEQLMAQLAGCLANHAEPHHRRLRGGPAKKLVNITMSRFSNAGN
jgi:hypothetical protein